LKVRDIMSRNVVTVGADVSVADAARKMKESNVGSVVVLDKNAVQGIVTDRKIVTNVIAENRDPGKEKIGSITSRKLVTCTEDSDVHDALKTLGDNKIRRCPVINDRKELVGVLSVSDIARDMKGCMNALFDEMSKASHEIEHHGEPGRPVIR
jgi:CBS domain-containing protein